MVAARTLQSAAALARSPWMCQCVSTASSWRVYGACTAFALSVRSALVGGISWRVPIGVSMRKRLSKKYKPTRVHKRWQKLNDFQDTGLNNVY